MKTVEKTLNRIETRFKQVRGRALKPTALVYTDHNTRGEVRAFAVAEHHSVGGVRKIQVSFGGRSSQAFQDQVISELKSRKRGLTFGQDL